MYIKMFNKLAHTSARSGRTICLQYKCCPKDAVLKILSLINLYCLSKSIAVLYSAIASDIRHVLNFHVLCISCIRDWSFMYVLSCIWKYLCIVMYFSMLIKFHICKKLKSFYTCKFKIFSYSLKKIYSN